MSLYNAHYTSQDAIQSRNGSMRSLLTKQYVLSKLLRLLAVLVIPTVAVGCAPCCCQIDLPEPKEIESDRVQGQFARWAMQNYGLEVVASGGSMMDEIKMLTLWFSSSQRVSVPEARRLLVTLIREFVRQINADEGIRPYLKTYPATEENVEVKVSFKSRSGTWFASPFIAFVYWGHRKVIEYVQAKYSDAEEGHEGNWRNAAFHNRHTETWQEAIQIVEQEEARVGFSPN